MLDAHPGGDALPHPLDYIPSSDRWGPFAPGLEPDERLARTRTLRAVATILLGQRGAVLAHSLLVAETCPDWLPMALASLDGLAALDRRRVLSAYGAVSCPNWRG